METGWGEQAEVLNCCFLRSRGAPEGATCYAAFSLEGATCYTISLEGAICYAAFHWRGTVLQTLMQCAGLCDTACSLVNWGSIWVLGSKTSFHLLV